MREPTFDDEDGLVGQRPLSPCHFDEALAHRIRK
jgi:hypothetical protein